MSQFRLFLRPFDGEQRPVNLPLKTRTINGAMRHAHSYAADVGLSGTVDVQERDGAMWRTLRTATVKDSEVTGWMVR